MEVKSDSGHMHRTSTYPFYLQKYTRHWNLFQEPHLPVVPPDAREEVRHHTMKPQLQEVCRAQGIYNELSQREVEILY